MVYIVSPGDISVNGLTNGTTLRPKRGILQGFYAKIGLRRVVQNLAGMAGFRPSDWPIRGHVG